MAGCAAAGWRLLRNQRTAKKTAAPSSNIIIMLAMPSPMPRCENSAASPIPAARPASGPIQRLMPDWAAAAGAAAAALAGAAALGAAAGLAGMASRFITVESRLTPVLLPPPRRLAASAS